MRIPEALDWPLLVAERLARQVYWSSPRLRAWVRRHREGTQPVPQAADRQELRQYLATVGVREGALVMAHTSSSALTLTDGPNGERATSSPVQVARQLVDDLLELVGATGTLVMPTQARYQVENEYGLNADPGVLDIYDPAKTPCGVGLANELFRRRKGTQRSLHPWDMLAARGPLASELLRDNLNGTKPLPHGVDSGYYRLCQKNALVIGVGVPLGRYLTLIHTAEDVRDQDWPVKDFFIEKEYMVRRDGRDEKCVVRKTRLEYGMFCLCMRKLCRDLRREGILHEEMVGTVNVGWTRAGEVFDHLMARNMKSPYPYYGTRFVRRHWRT